MVSSVLEQVCDIFLAASAIRQLLLGKHPCVFFWLLISQFYDLVADSAKLSKSRQHRS